MKLHNALYYVCVLLAGVLSLNAAGSSLPKGAKFPSELNESRILIADFNASDTEGQLPLAVLFRDSTSGDPTVWEWDFDNNGYIDSYDRNPVWLYEEAGVYTVSLTAFNDDGEMDTEIKYDYITVEELPEGLVACYHFNGNAEDLSLNEFDGTVEGAYLTEDRFGYANSAYYFAADGGHIEIPYNLFSNGFPFSMSFWFKAYEFEDYNVTFGSKTWDGGGEDVYYALATSNVGKDHVSFHLGNGNGGGPQHRISYSAPYDFSLHQWYHVIFIVDNMYMDEGRFIVNGEDQEFSHVSGYANSVDFSNGTFDIGATKCNGYSYSGEFPLLDGCLDDFYIFNRILTEEEIQNLYTPALRCDFVAVPQTGTLPLTVNFYDLTTYYTYPPDSWMWDFNGDNLIDSYQPNPVFTYEEAGTYNVKLRVCCSSLNYFDYEEKQNYITVDEGLMYGDVDDNRLVESVDAGLVLMHTVGFDPIPEDPLPWEEWRRIQADVDLDEEISAVDGAYILQYVVGIIEELPISGRDRFPKGKIALFCEDNYINLIAESDMYTLELDLNEFRQLDPEALELIAQDCITYQSGERFALISANGLKGKVLRIPYSKESVQATSLSFNPAVNGYNEKISLHFSDHIQLISTITSIYPNPFNPETSIQLYIAEDSQVNLSIYNLKGQLITELISEFKEMGNYSVIWNGMDKDSQYVSSGVYLIRFSAEGILEFSKIVYLK